MPPQIKICYFPAKGRAEPARLALTVGGVPFEDERIKGDEFVSKKPGLPFGSLPTMEVDGKLFAQSSAMLRYAGRLSGLYPEDPLEAFKVDMIVDGILDVQTPLSATFSIADPAEKLAARAKIVKEVIPRYVGALDRLIAAEPGEFCANGKLSIADIFVYTAVNQMRSGMLDGVPADCMDGYAAVMKAYNAVAAHPKVQEWEKAHS
ncbi:unnamed protein product [Pedinophyceae sp. YPF-701]|nr:unnamed protein product [Pedinophyceae sp. YPF-701]